MEREETGSAGDLSAVESRGGNDSRTDRPFNPLRVPRSANARRVVRDAILHLQAYEEHVGLRKRKRRQRDQQTFEAAVTAVVSDVAHRHLTAPGKWVAVPLSNQVLGLGGRYASRVLGQTLPDIVKRLAAPGMRHIELRMGQQGFMPGQGRRTTMRASGYVRACIEELELEPSDFGSDGTGELIILKEAKSDEFWTKAEWVDYEDTPATNQYRAEVERINRWLADANIGFDAWQWLDSDETVDSEDRKLRRYFNGSFEHGGRLFGGFWQPLSKAVRLRGITIKGERVCELDFGQMAPRLVYSLAGATPPPGDLYAVPGLATSREGVREGVKATFNAIMYSRNPLQRFPKNSRQGLRGKFQEILETIRGHHRGIASMFFKGVGMRTMFTESEVLIDVLLALMDVGIVALPIHDAILVPDSKADYARTTMMEVFKRHTGIEVEVATLRSPLTSATP